MEKLHKFVLFRYEPDLSDIEEISEPPSPVLHSFGGNQYFMILEPAVTELQDIIQSLRLKSLFDTDEVAEELSHFAEEKLGILQSAAREEIMADFDHVPQCFLPELTSLMNRIVTLAHILNVCFHKPHIDVVTIKLERVMLELKRLELETFFDCDAALKASKPAPGENALQELEQSLFERNPLARLYIESFELQKTRRKMQECLCWKCILRHLDESFKRMSVL